LTPFEQPHEQLQELERRREVAEGLRGILAVLNSNQSLEAILDYITSCASRLLGAEAVSIYRLQAESHLLSIQSSRGLSEEYLAHSVIPLGQLATGRAVFEGKPVVNNNVAELLTGMNQPLTSEMTTLLNVLSKQYRAVLSVPLVVKNEKVGALTLYYVQPRAFAQEEIDLAVSFCDQTALAIENARLREKIQEDAVAAERNRIARNLHDSVTQTIFSASLIAEVLPIIWKRDPQEAGQGLEELRKLTRGALAEMRTLLLELRPSGLSEARLEDLLTQLAEGISVRIRTPVATQIEEVAALPPHVKLVFYRIAQEALNNIIKHAGASEVAITLKSLPFQKAQRRKSSSGSLKLAQSVTMVIRDNGCGFDQKSVTGEHMGLGIMRERAHNARAAFSIRSQPGSGTEIILTWPGATRFSKDG